MYTRTYRNNVYATIQSVAGNQVFHRLSAARRAGQVVAGSSIPFVSRN